jgi:arsenate reductase-like glutaredoxin family protein
MTDEIDDDILEAELEDDALEKKMKKLESEAARLLNHSSELLKALSKESPKQEETPPEKDVKGEE